jgi:acetyl-CoA carboxylase biotin carboxylase subunit
MLAKIIVWGEDRPQALARMTRALSEFGIDGIATTVPFAQAVLAAPAFRSRDFHTTWLEQWLPDFQAAATGEADA